MTVARGQTPAFGPGITNGVVRAAQIWEASGIVSSRQNPGVLWTHNDSGFPGTIFALSTNGVLLAQCSISNVYSGDFEDIAIGPGQSPGMQCVYLGDIGDNFASRAEIHVFQIPEPAIYDYFSNAPPTLPALGARQITLTYPDGPHDAESLMVDAVTGDLFIAIKETNSCSLYQATRAQLSAGDTVQLSYVEGISFRSVSAGDISGDGSLMAIRRSNRAELWRRGSGQTVSNAFLAASIRIPIIGTPVEPNGEGLGFEANGQGYFTISEGFNPAIYFFPRMDAGKPDLPRTFIESGSGWRYLDDGGDQDIFWRAPEYDDVFWIEGTAQFGYGQGDEATPIFFGYELDKNVTTYFRKQFQVDTVAGLSNLVLRASFNDGIAVYLNGEEVWRRNLPADALFNTPALSDRSVWQNIWWSTAMDPARLHPGINTIAVEVHRFAPDGPDLSFDLQLVEGRVEPSVQFTSFPQVSGGICQLRLSGAAGAFAVVEASADLKDWSLWEQTMLDGQGSGTMSGVVSNDQQFFRVAELIGSPRP